MFETELRVENVIKIKKIKMKKPIKFQARAMSHLEEISEEGIQAMSKSGSVAVLLPSTAFILRLTPPPARKLIENKVIVALGSDFNPNAYCLAMPMIMHFGSLL